MFPATPYTVWRKSERAVTVLILAVGVLFIVGYVGFLGFGVWLSLDGRFDSAGERVKFALITTGLPTLLILACGLWLWRGMPGRLVRLRWAKVPLLHIDAVGVHVDGGFAAWADIGRIVIVPFSVAEGQPAVSVNVMYRQEPDGWPAIATVPPILSLNVSTAEQRVDLNQVVAAIRTFGPPGLELLEYNRGYLRGI